MGQQLLEFYERAKGKGGMQAQVKLAMLTQISSVKARELPDDTENIKKFSEAFKQIEADFS